jgi:hypothetical protein
MNSLSFTVLEYSQYKVTSGRMVLCSGRYFPLVEPHIRGSNRIIILPASMTIFFTNLLTNCKASLDPYHLHLEVTTSVPECYVSGGGEGKRRILIGQSVPPTPFGMAFGRLKGTVSREF